MELSVRAPRLTDSHHQASILGAEDTATFLSTFSTDGRQVFPGPGIHPPSVTRL